MLQGLWARYQRSGKAQKWYMPLTCRLGIFRRMPKPWCPGGVENKGLTDFKVGRVRWSVGVVRTAMWAVAGLGLGKLVDTVF